MKVLYIIKSVDTDCVLDVVISDYLSYSDCEEAFYDYLALVNDLPRFYIEKYLLDDVPLI